MTIQSWIAGDTADAIAGSIERGLHQGRAGAGDLLPTVRDLAEALGVSPATVAAAFKALRLRGLVYGDGRRGTRVTLRAAPARAPRAAVNASLTDLASGEPDPLLLPALPDLASAPRHDLAPDLRPLTTFAAAEFEADSVDSRFVAVVQGALDGIERVLREHLRPGDQVAIEDPGYPLVTDLVAAAGYGVRPFRVDDEGPLVEDVTAALRTRCQAVLFTPRAQNPTGAAITPERARELRRACRAFPDVLVVENDPAGPVAGVPFVTVTSGAQRWAVVRSTSKFLGPDLRVAVMAGDELTIARVRARYSLGPRWVSGILQQLVLTMWSDPAAGRRIARAAEIYAQRRAALLAALRSHEIDAHGRSGLNVWVPVREETSVTLALAEQGWAVAAGERFRSRTPPGIRVTTATLAPPDAPQFAAALAAALRPATRPR